MNNPLKTSLFTVLFVFIGLFLFVKFAGPLPFSVTSVTTTKDRLFTVEGQAEATAIPDSALISFGVTKDATSVQQAKDEVNKITNQITEDIKKLGVEVKDIKTTNYSVNPQYDYAFGKQQLRGYTISADMQVKLKPIDQANKAIDLATKLGATNVGGVQFVLEDSKQKALENQARKEAIDNAKEKAKSLADAAGIKLGRIIDIQENGGVQPPVRYALMKSMDAAGEEQKPATELSPGENKISVSITLSYETR